MNSGPSARFTKSVTSEVQKRILGGSAWSAELDEEIVEVLSGELPFEGLSRSCPILLKVQKAFGDSVEIGKIIGCQDLPLDD